MSGPELSDNPSPAAAGILESLTVENVQTWIYNFQHNAQTAVERLQPKDYVRLIAIIGGYCLLRPYLIKLGGKHQARDHERALATGDTNPPAVPSSNTLREQVDMPDDSDDDEGLASGTGADWGKNARKKQRRTLKQILEAERKGAMEEADSDKEIEEFLQKVIE